MATTPYSLLVAGTTLASGDYLTWLDVSDLSQSPSGSVLKISITNFFATVPAPIAQTTGTVVVSTPVYQATQTWNDAAVTFTAIDLNITSTASAAGSLLANLRVGGTSQWKVTKGGAVTQVGDHAVGATKFVVTAASGNFVSAGTGQVATTFGVGGATPAASGQGVTFNNTPNGSSDDNTFDYYKRTDWTPTLGGTSTATTAVGRVTKSGRKVRIWGIYTCNTLGSGSQSILSGLPYASANNGITTPVVISRWSGVSATGCFLIGEIAPNASTITFNMADAANQSAISNVGLNIFQNGASIRFCAEYEAAS